MSAKEPLILALQGGRGGLEGAFVAIQQRVGAGGEQKEKWVDNLPVPLADRWPWLDREYSTLQPPALFDLFLFARGRTNEIDCAWLIELKTNERSLTNGIKNKWTAPEVAALKEIDEASAMNSICQQYWKRNEIKSTRYAHHGTGHWGAAGSARMQEIINWTKHSSTHFSVEKRKNLISTTRREGTSSSARDALVSSFLEMLDFLPSQVADNHACGLPIRLADAGNKFQRTKSSTVFLWKFEGSSYFENSSFWKQKGFFD
jgi:hypothetical protein